MNNFVTCIENDISHIISPVKVNYVGANQDKLQCIDFDTEIKRQIK